MARGYEWAGSLIGLFPLSLTVSEVEISLGYTVLAIFA